MAPGISDGNIVVETIPLMRLLREQAGLIIKLLVPQNGSDRMYVPTKSAVLKSSAEQRR
jgi:hypothetical protein